MKTNLKTLGEFGRHGGKTVLAVREVPGHVREIRRLWAELDCCDGPREDEIFTRLDELGATKEA